MLLFKKKIEVIKLECHIFSELFFSYGFMLYVTVAIAVGMNFIFNKTRVGLNLRAVGESPATADAAGINVTRYKYVASCVGSGITGLAGVYCVM